MSAAVLSCGAAPMGALEVEMGRWTALLVVLAVACLGIAHASTTDTGLRSILVAGGVVPHDCSDFLSERPDVQAIACGTYDDIALLLDALKVLGYTPEMKLDEDETSASYLFSKGDGYVMLRITVRGTVFLVSR